jgi:hypothetical protein
MRARAGSRVTTHAPAPPAAKTTPPPTSARNFRLFVMIVSVGLISNYIVRYQTISKTGLSIVGNTAVSSGLSVPNRYIQANVQRS